MQELTQLTNKVICSNTKSMNWKVGAHFYKGGWVDPTYRAVGYNEPARDSPLPDV